MMKELIEQYKKEVGLSREETQDAFDRLGAQLDEVVRIKEDTGRDTLHIAVPPKQLALVLLECSLQLEVIQAMDQQDKAATVLLEESLSKLNKMKALEESHASLLSTIFQTWCYLGRYTNDSDAATHAKRLLQNCLLVRGDEKTQAAVKKKLLSPPPVKWYRHIALDYLGFAAGLSVFVMAMHQSDFGYAAVAFGLVIWNAVDVARKSAKGGKHVQA